MSRWLPWLLLLAALPGALAMLGGTQAFSEAVQAGPAYLHIQKGTAPPVAADPRPLLYCTAPSAITLTKPASVTVPVACHNGFLSALSLDLAASLQGGGTPKPSLSPNSLSELVVYPLTSETVSFVVSAGGTTAAGDYLLRLAASTTPNTSDVEVTFPTTILITVK